MGILRNKHQGCRTSRKQRLLLQSLEGRVLFSASPLSDPLPDLTPLDDAEDPLAVDETVAAVSDAARPNQAESARTTLGHEIVFVDGRVRDVQPWIENLDARIELVFLHGQEDGLHQIARHVQQRAVEGSPLTAIHLISHGTPGELQLGNNRLTLQSMSTQHADALNSIRLGLAHDADVLIYGCNFGQGDEGRQAVQLLSTLTGADVGASDDLTGTQTQTGAQSGTGVPTDTGLPDADWQLEVLFGVLDTLMLPQTGWVGVLAAEATESIVTVQDAENSTAGSVTLGSDLAPLSVTTSGTPVRVGQMLERVWSYTESADVGAASFVIDVNAIGGIGATQAAEFGLIISKQSDLSTAAGTTLVASGYDATSGLVYFHGIDLDAGDFFGLATKVEPDNFSVFPTATGLEDTPIDLGLTLSSAITDGGTLRDILSTEIGFRASTAGSNTTEFLIPAGTTGIKITGYSTRDIGTSAVDSRNDDYQTMNVSIDLDAETSNGFIAHLIDQGPNRSDQFAWTNAPLGTSVLAGGTITGDANDNIDPVFSIYNGVLQISENHQLQTAYHVEFLTNATSSAEFVQTASAVREDGDQSSVSLAIPGNADFVVISIADAATSSDSQVEYKGNSRIVLDLETLTASGTVAAQRGETDARVLSYAFKDYDSSSSGVGSILSSGAAVVGDSTENAGLLNDPQIYVSGGNLVIDRENTFARNFNSLVTVEFYERKPVGSSATKVGDAADYGLWNSDPSDPVSSLEFDIPADATLGIFNLSMNGTRTSDTNENMGAGFAVVDLLNGTSSGTMYMVRTGNKVDFVAWNSTDLGTVFFQDPQTISNHISINQFNDKFAGNAVFSLTNGGSTLELATNSPGGRQSYLDYYAGGQIEWYGSAPFELLGLPVGGSFSQGALNTSTGNWDLTVQQALAGGLFFVPGAHLSGTTPIDVSIQIGDEVDSSQVRIEAVIDAISFDVADASGDEDTDIAIGDIVSPTFVDQDGSETLTSLRLANIEVGHTVSDGTNTFVATSGSQSVNITGWDVSALTYRANAEESGTFSVTMEVDWQDVGGGVTDTDSLSTTFDVQVKPVNDVPVAVNDFYAILGNTTLDINAVSGTVANDSDPELDTLTVVSTPLTGPANGALSLNTDGSFTYTPTVGFVGTDSFVYQVSDGNGGSDAATVFVDVSPPVTGPLDAVDDALTVNEETLLNINVMDNDDLPTTGAYNVQSTTPASDGSIAVQSDGTIDYTPNADYFGPDSFTYTLADASGRTSTATVRVTVLNVQDAPVANADSSTTPEDTALLSLEVLANDFDPDGDVLTVTSGTSPNGTIVVLFDGTIDYTPNLNFTGVDTVTYQVSDGNGGFDTSTVAINVVPVADPPTSANHTVCLDEDSEYVFTGADFAFLDGDPADVITLVRIDSLPSDGELLLLGNSVSAGQVVAVGDVVAGRLAFRPDVDGFGASYASFDFSVSDGALFQVTPNAMTLCVNSMQDPPIATNAAMTVDEESIGTPLGLAAPTDIDGDTLTVTITGLPSLGSVLLSDGVTAISHGQSLTVPQLTGLLYDAPADYILGDPGDLTYGVTDGNAFDSGSVDITITPINDASWVDLNGTGTSGENFKATFTEGDAAVPITDADVDVRDVDSATLQSIAIVVGGVVDGADEILALDGFEFDLSASTTQAVTIASTTFDVVYDSGSGLFSITTASGGISLAAAESLLASANYRNNSTLPTTSDRTFDIAVRDAVGAVSNAPTATICVARTAEVAAWTLTGSSSVVDGNAAMYSISLPAPLRAGETASVDVSLTDVDTQSADYSVLSAAVATAVSSYAGPGNATWNGVTLNVTSDGTGAMTALAISLATTPDSNYEGDEDYRISLANPASTTGQSISIAAGIVTTTILDNHTAPTVFIADASAVEGSPLEFGVSVDIASHEDVVLDLSVASGSATTIADFEASNFEFFDGANWQPATSGTQVTLAAGSTVLPVRVDSVQDGLVEVDETFQLSAAVLAGTVTNATDTGMGTIVNDDTGTLSIDDVTVDEDNGTLVFTVSLDQPSASTVTTNFATASGTGSGTGAGAATQGIDFAAASGTLTFSPGEQSQTISVSIIDDDLLEISESMTVNLSAASGASIGDAQGVGTLVDDGTGPNGTDDDRPWLSVANVTATESEDSHAEFVVSLSNSSSQTTELSLALADVTATSGSDFGPGLEFFDGTVWQAVSGSVTLAAGSMSLLIRTPIIDDPIIDGGETYTLTATRVTGVTRNVSDQGTGTIFDDPTPDVTEVEISGSSAVLEGNLASYVVSINNTPITPVTVVFTYSGAASGGSDYAGLAAVTIPAGRSTATFDIATIDDTLGEPLESFTVTIDSISGGSLEATQISASNHAVTTAISDDDAPLISINDVVVTEGSDAHAEFTVELSNPTWEGIRFAISPTPVTAGGESVDYGIVGTDELEFFDGTNWLPVTSTVIPSGNTSVRLRTPIVDDVFAEVLESFLVEVQVLSGTTINPSSTGVGAIQEDSLAPETVLTSLTGPVSVTEGSTTSDYTLSLTDVPVEDVTVTLTYSGTATDGVDFSGVATVTILTGAATATFTLPSVDDAFYEIDEDIVVTIDSVTGGGFEGISSDPAADEVTTTITDVADIPALTINNVTSVEGTDSFAVFAVELNNLSIEDIDFAISLAAGTALGSGSDFGSGGSDNLQRFDGTNWVDATSATIESGKFSVLVRTPIIDDTLDEPIENYTLTADVTSGTTTNVQAMGTGTIVDNDAAPDISLDDTASNEGDMLVFDLSLTNASSQPIAIELSATNGSATSATDYTNNAFEFSSDGGSTWNPAASGTQVTVPALLTAIQVRLPTTQDLTLESSETMTLSMASVNSGAAGNIADTAVGTIHDDDSALVSIAANAPLAAEPGDDAQFTITLTNPSDAPTTIAYAVSGTSTSGADYDALSGTVTFATGQTSELIDVSLMDDALVEGDEDVTVLLTSITAGDSQVVVDLTNDVATATIADDDQAEWTIGGSTSVNEGGDAIYNVNLVGALESGESVSVDLLLTDSQTTSTDYAAWNSVVATSVGNYGGPGSLAWDGTTLRFTSDGSGNMAQLPIALRATNDVVVEGTEDLVVSLANANSTTGASVRIDLAQDQVATIIQDTVDALATSLDTANWSIIGSANVDEDATAQYTISLDAALGAGETAIVQIGLSDLDTTSVDYADVVAALTVAAAANPDITFDGSTGQLTYIAPNDAAMMVDLVVDLDIFNDTLIEGPEDYSLGLTVPSSSTGASVGIDVNAGEVTTQINDTQGVGGAADGPGTWSIIGPTSAAEGSTPRYTVSLSGLFGAGEVGSVMLALSDVGTHSSDYAALTAAIGSAVVGDPAVTFDAATNTLTYTSGTDGAGMSDIVIDLAIVDDGFVEGVEDYSLLLSSAGSSTGASLAIDSLAAEVVTTIQDTQGVGGVADGPAEWSLSGPASTDEGANASYTVSLSGAFGIGEIATVDLGLLNLSTNSSDYADLVAAATSAAAATADVSFNTGTATFAYVSPSDGSTMPDVLIDLAILNDANIEGPEDLLLALSTATTSTGANVRIAPLADRVTTTINDTQGAGGAAEGPAEWSLSGATFADEGGDAQYIISVTGAFGGGETTSVEINHADLTTTSTTDYADVGAAIAAAAALDGSVTFDVATGVMTYVAPLDGASLVPLVVDLSITDDAIIEGPEQFQITLANPTSSTSANVSLHASDTSVTTEINDTQGLGGDLDGPATWSIMGPATTDEGGAPQYSISLTGQFGAGELVTVDVGLTDNSTNPTDYAAFTTAMSNAVAANPGVSFNTATHTISYLAASDGESMTDIVLDLGITNDSLIEGPEDFTLDLSNPTTTTAANLTVDLLAGSVTTEINDTQGVSGSGDGPGRWSITGPTSADEGSTPQYTVSLDGQFGAGESVSVDVGLTDIGTNFDDYAALLAALTATATANADVTVDVTNGRLTFTAVADGASMSDQQVDMVIVNDNLIEGPEDFRLELFNASSITSAAVSIDGTFRQVVTAVHDTQGQGGSPDGPATWSITGATEVAEGTNAGYTVALAGIFQAGELVSVDIGLTNGTTDTADYGDLLNEVTIAANSDASLAFNSSSGTLTYTSPADGASMTGLSFDLPISDDMVRELPEDYRVALSNSASASGVAHAINALASSVATVINGDPHLTDDVQHTSVDTPVTHNVLANDSDPDGDLLSVNTTPVILPANGTLVLAANGTFTYTPNPGFRGIDSFDYQACDGLGNCEVATQTILIADLSAAKSQSNVSANGDSFDVSFTIVVENTGSTRMDNLSLFDDIETQLGATFLSVGTPVLDTTQIGQGIAPTLNAAWSSDTSLDMLDADSTNEFLMPGDSFSISYTAALDPDVSGTSTPLSNQATVTGEDITTRPSPLAVSDASDSGSDPATDNLGASGDSGGEDDATPLTIPDLRVVKRQVGTPTQQPDRSWNVDIEIIIENTGTVEIVSPALFDDVVLQLGDAWHGNSNLAIDTAGVSMGGAAPGLNSEWLTDPTQDLFDGTGVLQPGELVRVTFVLNLDPDDASSGRSRPITNQASVAGNATDAMGSPVTVTDLSDVGADPNTTNSLDAGDQGTSNDPTPISISEIGVAKRIVSSTPIVGSPGHVELIYELRVRNLATNELSNITLQDTLSTNLGPAFQGLRTPPAIVASTASLDPSMATAVFDGFGNSQIFDGTSGLLKPSEELVVQFALEVQIDLLRSASMNQSLAGADDRSLNPVADLSDAGSDPAGTNPQQTGDTGGEDDPTLPPAIGVAKNHGNAVPVDQDWSVPVEIFVQDLGLTDLQNLVLLEDIRSAFGAAFLSVSIPELDGSNVVGGVAPEINSAWMGDTSQNLLDGSGFLTPGDAFVVRFDVLVDPDVAGTSAYLFNQATVTATDPSNSASLVIDTSDSGMHATSSNPGAPGDRGLTDDATPLQIPDVGLAKQVTQVQQNGAAFDLTIVLLLENTGTVDVAELVLMDNVVAQFAPHAVTVAALPTILVSNATENPDFNFGFLSDTSQNLFDGTSGLLSPGQSISVQLVVRVLPNYAALNQGALELRNQASAQGKGVDSAGVAILGDGGNPLPVASDQSDSGPNPNANNGVGGFGDPLFTRLQVFAWDSFHNFATLSPPVSTQHPLASPRPLLNTYYTGMSQPGATLELRILDQSGLQVGTRTVQADAAGNWLASFPNATRNADDTHYGTTHFGASFDRTWSANSLFQQSEFGARGGRIFHSAHSAVSGYSARTMTVSTPGQHLFPVPGTEVDGQPLRVEVRTTPPVQSSPLQNRFGATVWRYFQPSLHPASHVSSSMTTSQVIAEQPANTLHRLHAANTRPLGFGLN